MILRISESSSSLKLPRGPLRIRSSFDVIAIRVPSLREAAQDISAPRQAPPQGFATRNEQSD
jgi:hypothetical protein